jgi:nucleoside-diphosphate-sugar epimerase
MNQTEPAAFIIKRDDPHQITGATGFIGSRLVESLLDCGFRNLRCFVRPSSDKSAVESLVGRRREGARVRVVKGDLLSREDCIAAAKGATVIFHLATGGEGKSFPDAFLNSVVTTRNLLEASLKFQSLRRFVNVSSFAVYTNTQKPRRGLLDETCPVEKHPELRWDAYCYAKVKQDELVTEYGKEFGIPCVIVRPGYVYGPGREAISNRVGIDTFGIFLHLGGSNQIPLTYVENCADAIALAGLKPGIDGEVFNIVDDDLPSSRQFLRQYKRNVRRFKSLYVPHALSYALCFLWEQYAAWSEGRMAANFNRLKWHTYWKKTRYSNDKLKKRVGWTPRVPTAVGFHRYFEACRFGEPHA